MVGIIIFYLWQILTCLDHMKENKSFTEGLPWKVGFALSLMVAVTDYARHSDNSINRRLLNLLIPSSRVHRRAVGGVKISDITIDPVRNLWFRLFVPTGVPVGTKLPVQVFFHGGAFSYLSPDTREYHAICHQFTLKTPAIVISVNYRLAPEHRCPAPYQDGYDTLQFLDQKGFGRFPENADLSRCFLSGDSAGANIAHHVARRISQNELDFSELKVVGLIAIQPWFGGIERTESEIRLEGAPVASIDKADWHWKLFLPEGADRAHEAVNVFGPKSTDISRLENFPATLVVVGGLDPLQDWQKRYYEGLKNSGKKAQLIEYPNAFHTFYIFPELPEAKLLLTAVTKFIHRNGEIIEDV